MAPDASSTGVGSGERITTAANKAYLSYFAGGLRALRVDCSGPSTCELVEVGSYLDPNGNNFWGG